eukprot:5297701-Prymnesium_polylepis.1
MKFQRAPPPGPVHPRWTPGDRHTPNSHRHQLLNSPTCCLRGQSHPGDLFAQMPSHPKAELVVAA